MDNLTLVEIGTLKIISLSKIVCPSRIVLNDLDIEYTISIMNEMESYRKDFSFQCEDRVKFHIITHMILLSLNDKYIIINYIFFKSHFKYIIN